MRRSLRLVLGRCCLGRNSLSRLTPSLRLARLTPLVERRHDLLDLRVRGLQVATTIPGDDVRALRYAIQEPISPFATARRTNGGHRYQPKVLTVRGGRLRARRIALFQDALSISSITTRDSNPIEGTAWASLAELVGSNTRVLDERACARVNERLERRPATSTEASGRCRSLIAPTVAAATTATETTAATAATTATAA